MIRGGCAEGAAPEEAEEAQGPAGGAKASEEEDELDEDEEDEEEEEEEFLTPVVDAKTSEALGPVLGTKTCVSSWTSGRVTHAGRVRSRPLCAKGALQADFSRGR